jgi:hypothetical protein
VTPNCRISTVDAHRGRDNSLSPAPSSSVDGMLMQQSRLSAFASCPSRKGDSIAAKCVASAAMCPNSCISTNTGLMQQGPLTYHSCHAHVQQEPHHQKVLTAAIELLWTADRAIHVWPRP